MVTILINMLPDSVADSFVQKYEVGQTSLESIEPEVTDYLSKVDQKSKHVSKSSNRQSCIHVSWV